MIFEKKVVDLKMSVLIFSTTFVQKISHFKKNLAIYCHKCAKSSCNISVIIIDETFNFHDRFSKTSSNIKFHHNPFFGRRVPCGRTDEHDEANSRFSQFC